MCTRKLSCLALSVTTAFLANTASGRPDRPKEGRASESCPDPDPASAIPTVSFDFSCTDAAGHEIDAHGWPRSVAATRIGNGRVASQCQIPAALQPSAGGAPVDVKDYISVKRVNGLLVGSLNVEGVHVEGGVSTLWSVFGILSDRVGDDTVVPVPRLEAADGTLLYCLADVNRYLDAVPAFSIGDHVSVTGGGVPGWGGFMVSTTPFTFSAASGWVGTAWSGETTIAGEAQLQAVPTPGAGGALGTALLLGAGRRRRADR